MTRLALKTLGWVALAYAIVASAATLRAGDITSNLQVRLPFDETSGTNAPDASGNGRNGTTVNSPTWIAGQIGSGALRLNATNQYVDIAGLANYMGTQTEITCAFWFKPNATGADTNDRIVDVGGFDLLVSPITSGFNRVSVSSRTNAGNVAPIVESGDNGYTAGTWQLITIVIKSGANVIYNGTTSVATSSTTYTSLATDGDDYFRIASATIPWPGDIDEFRFYNRALTSGDVADLAAFTGGAAPAARRRNAIIVGSFKPPWQPVDVLWQASNIFEAIAP